MKFVNRSVKSNQKIHLGEDGPGPIFPTDNGTPSIVDYLIDTVVHLGDAFLDENERANSRGGLSKDERVDDLKVAADFALAVANNPGDGEVDGRDDSLKVGIQAYERALRGKALDSNNAEIERTDKKQFFNEDFTINFNNDGQFYNNIWSEVKKLLLGIIKISK